MEVKLKYDCGGVDWAAVSDTLKRVGMANRAPELHQKAFEASHTAVFAYSNDQLVGFGRAISDGAYQAAVYEMAVVPEFQRRGIGALWKTVPGVGVDPRTGAEVTTTKRELVVRDDLPMKDEYADFVRDLVVGQ